MKSFGSSLLGVSKTRQQPTQQETKFCRHNLNNTHNTTTNHNRQNNRHKHDHNKHKTHSNHCNQVNNNNKRQTDPPSCRLTMTKSPMNPLMDQLRWRLSLPPTAVTISVIAVSIVVFHHRQNNVAKTRCLTPASQTSHSCYPSQEEPADRPLPLPGDTLCQPRSERVLLRWVRDLPPY